jgi:hypothetical protein
MFGTFDDHIVCCGDSAAHHPKPVDQRAGGDFPLLDLVAPAYDVNDLVALLRCDRVIRDQQRIVCSGSQKPQMAEHAWCEQQFRIRNLGAAADGAGVRVHRIVHEIHPAFDGVVGLILQAYFDRIGMVARLRPRTHLTEIFIFQVKRLRPVEDEADRVEIGDICQDRGVLRHEISGCHAPVRGTAVDGRGDAGEAEVERGALHRRFRRQNIGCRLLRRGEPGLIFLLCDGAVGVQLLRARKLDIGVRFRGQRVGFLPLRLVEYRMVGSGIDDEQEVALMDHLAVTEIDGLQITADARPNIHRIDGLEMAHEIVPVDDLPFQRFGGNDVDGRRRRRPVSRASGKR